MIAWFVCTYKRDLSALGPTRYCAMDDFTALIRAEGGDWDEAEVLGDYAIVKVRASETLLATIEGTAGFFRLPDIQLEDRIGDFTNQGQRNRLRRALEDAGYPDAEIDAAFPTGLADATFEDFLNFLATRRLKPRYDAPSDTIVLDGPVQPVKPVRTVHGRV